MQPEPSIPPPARVAVVTGAGSGIGAATALALAGDGGRWRSPGGGPALNEVADGRRATRWADPVPTDVTEESSVDACSMLWPPAAGGSTCCSTTPECSRPAREPDEITLTEWNAIVAVNLTGASSAPGGVPGDAQPATPQGGRIINNGSISAHAPRPGSTGYTVTKHAISGLTKRPPDGRPYDIACGQIDIGNAATGLANFSDGMMQPDGNVRPEPIWTSRTSAGRCCTWPACR